MLWQIWTYCHYVFSVISINKMNVFVNGYVWRSVNILMLIWADVFIYQTKVMNEEKSQLNSLQYSWIANSTDGDTALCQNM